MDKGLEVCLACKFQMNQGGARFAGWRQVFERQAVAVQVKRQHICAGLQGLTQALIAALSAALGDFSREVATVVSGLPRFQTAPAPADRADQSPPS